MPYQEPEFLPWDGRQVPLTLIGGYLGAGKTTAINELLARSDRPIAVLVNDVGDVNIDAKLIKRRHGDTIELTDGCICCSMIDGFGAAFDMIRNREIPPDQVVVELSGVAEPARVRPWGKSAGFYLDAVVVLVDVSQYEELIATPSGQHVQTQIRQADVLVLTKSDLVGVSTAARVRALISELAPDTPVVAFDQAMSTAGLLSTGSRSGASVVDVPPSTLFDAHTVSSVSLAGVVDEDSISRILDQLPATTVRAKGIAQLADGSKLLIHQVGPQRSVTALSAAESQDATDLVVITVG